MQTADIYVTPTAAQLEEGGAPYPTYKKFSPVYDAVGYPDNNGDVSGKYSNPTEYAQGQYAYFLNEIRSAIQNVTSADVPLDGPAFACNPAVNELNDLLQYLYEVQGIAGDQTLPLSPPLVTGPLPPGTIAQ